MKIGNINIDIPLVLAPMAGVTDLPYRKLVKEQGCGLLVSEMISCKGLLYNNQKTIDIMQFEQIERPFAVQLFGSDPKEMAQAAKLTAQHSPDIIDINMGCPVAKVVNNGEGSALMKTPELIYEIVSRMVESVNIPITVKIRSGWDEDNINACEIASTIEKAGASAIAIHARTRSQFYMGKADWQIIQKVASAVKIPVIGNGDIKNHTDALQMMQQTGCQAVMIGRAAEGNPWLFSQITAALLNKTVPDKPTITERFNLLQRHLKLLIEHKGETIAIKEMRRHGASYTKGLPHAAEFRNLFNMANNQEDFSKIIESYIAKLNQLTNTGDQEFV